MGFCVKLKRIAAAISAAAVFSCAYAAGPEEVGSAAKAALAYKLGGKATLAEALTPGEEAAGYLEKLESYVAERYAESGGLDEHKATEWHRVILTVRALGGNPESFGGVNLVRDGITEPLVPPERQGVNGLVWAALAAKGSGSPEAEAKIGEFCSALASRQNSDGSFSLRGAGDSDLTAMAIRAFCGVAGFENNLAAARSALDALRLPSGGFASSGVENSESCAQVILALCELGERPDAEAEVLLKYQNPDGGFAHLPEGKSNNMATAQALLALAAYERACALASAAEASAEAEPVSEQAYKPVPEAASVPETVPASAPATPAEAEAPHQSAADTKTEPAPETAVPTEAPAETLHEAAPEAVPEEVIPMESDGSVGEAKSKEKQSSATERKGPNRLPVSAFLTGLAAVVAALVIIRLKK